MREHSANERIRTAIKQLGLFNWQAAEILGISESYLSKIIRKEMPLSEQDEIIVRIREGAKNYDAKY